MNAFITQQAASVGAQPRPRVHVDMAQAHRPNGSARQVLGVALVAIGTRLAGEMPAAKAVRPEGERA
jgi:hypothetical protein